MQLNDIKYYWNASYQDNFNDCNMAEGQFVLYEDGWFEGIVVDSQDQSLGDVFIFGAYAQDIGVEMFRISPQNNDVSLVFRVSKDEEGYKGQFSIIDMYSQQPCGVSRLYVKVAEKQEGIGQLEERIKKFKAKMAKKNQDFYNDKLKISRLLIITNKVSNQLGTKKR